MAKIRVPRTRNNMTMTEGMYWGFVRSMLRKGFKYWKPIMEAKKRNRTKHPFKSRQKFDYHCEVCKGVYPEKEIQVDHTIPAGKLTCYEDLPEFVKNLSVEYSEENYSVVCKPCHQKKTNLERNL